MNHSGQPSYVLVFIEMPSYITVESSLRQQFRKSIIGAMLFIYIKIGLSTFRKFAKSQRSFNPVGCWLDVNLQTNNTLTSCSDGLYKYIQVYTSIYLYKHVYTCSDGLYLYKPYTCTNHLLNTLFVHNWETSHWTLIKYYIQTKIYIKTTMYNTQWIYTFPNLP